MTKSLFTAATLDDVLRNTIKAIQADGNQIKATKGSAIELTGVLLEITNPRARLSRTETRGKPFSCLGELCWYLAKTNDLGFIQYYLPEYSKYADGDTIYGGYGPRLFNWDGLDQFANVVELLKSKPHSRQAVIQLFDAHDIVDQHKDIPCTCTLQFMIRSSKLHMFTNMRSNDVSWGLPHDVFCFTMLQEIMARTLSVELGSYKHAVGSLHIYDINKNEAQQFLDEGWQSTDSPMPPMPLGDPWTSIASLRKAEAVIRIEGADKYQESDSLNPYWADLIRLLQIFGFSNDTKAADIRELQPKMSSNIYNPFINKRLERIS